MPLRCTSDIVWLPIVLLHLCFSTVPLLQMLLGTHLTTERAHFKGTWSVVGLYSPPLISVSHPFLFFPTQHVWITPISGIVVFGSSEFNDFRGVAVSTPEWSDSTTRDLSTVWTFSKSSKMLISGKGRDLHKHIFKLYIQHTCRLWWTLLGVLVSISQPLTPPLCHTRTLQIAIYLVHGMGEFLQYIRIIDWQYNWWLSNWDGGGLMWNQQRDTWMWKPKWINAPFFVEHFCMPMLISSNLNWWAFRWSWRFGVCAFIHSLTS